MKTIAILGVLLGGLAASCGGGSTNAVTPDGGMAGKTGGTAGSSGAAGTAGSSGAAGTNGTCGKVQPCGGSLVGSWTVASTCFLQADITPSDLIDVCPIAKLEALSATANGTATFTATTYVNTGTITVQSRLTMPLSCFGAGKDCAGLQAVYVDQGFFQSPTCAVQGTSCICALNAVQDAAGSGTYTTSGTTLTSTDADGTTSADPYCVVGNELHSMDVDPDMPTGPTGMANVQGDTVFTKR
jgi:hypothetical protein